MKVHPDPSHLVAQVRHANAEPSAAREPYQPGSGMEGALFMESFCDRCERDAAFRAGAGDSCPIVAATMILDIEDPDYPPEWREDGPEGPRCTAFTPETPPLADAAPQARTADASRDE
jgi:hypothetical protein